MSVHYVDAFMRAALREAELALEEGEVPVGCALVRTDANETVYAKLALQSSDAVTNAPPHAASSLRCDQLVESCIAARGRNQTNLQHHALAHAEFIAVQKLIDDATRGGDGSAGASSSKAGAGEGEKELVEDGKQNGLTSSPTTPPLSGLADYVLYVTVEPCVMCGAMLLYNRIAHVFFGCRNPRFGGNGTVLALHASPFPQQRLRRQPSQPDQPAASTPRFAGMSKGSPSVDEGGIVCSGEWWPGYVSEGGHTEAEAISLLQRFYERENPNAPGHKRRRKA
ncbi:deaminase [Leishmania donovani]|uniref:Deaminase_-_putative n=3 Tax=Leishmania donovani species complex TaxID=38574 RepID=A0A6L0WJP5_LEIIN|nr:putative deaminase [Leishmania infantum JPCM5]XP_003858914.1 deaminase, putative [Leishmania donovani]CAC9457993.1 deaminase_-_putative [Leishmania infantum]AYU76700.1 deaminase, putative [Leishmania donovani]TPP46591.1 Cytidine and deoxycytidylate deaminase zinc-binding region family protein [Leishmania donovani]TPP52610.1 Cytidine and deoxycytidylate deaminase zinc-binding region family protein [Leishmania donovani]CAJ1986759.1 deaminase [Leishmania donovani]|eukprot:XP_001463726.1 putative deaminase [Leishmania infantum JPCM5]